MLIKTTETRTLPVRNPITYPVHEGRKFVLTGGARGLGRATAELLIAQGARVALIDVLEDELKTTAQELGGEAAGVYAVKGDLSDTTSIHQAAARAIELLDGVDGLANIAGIVRHSNPLEIPAQDWDIQLKINLIGSYEFSRAVAKHLIETGRPGAIVNVASEAGKVGHAESLAYSASKAAVISQTRMLSAALAYADINVNCVCPGGMPTKMLREVADAYSGKIGQAAEDIFDAMENEQVGRHIEVAEVARVISFLLSDDAFAIRGQAINADGGKTPY
ncbi:SDR family NAD(P)-dependent oxidoreductase [Paenarthrobacter sp. NPDC018779]|uniref:SDR family NAD(P)-dependent oxidoreductase n=1 Tax=Paenarthrobacter sp. NPDC018779 TaxID=3364375 RepID=UPI0037C8EDC8